MPPRILTYKRFREKKTDQGFVFVFVLLSVKEDEKEEVILEYNNQKPIPGTYSS